MFMLYRLDVNTDVFVSKISPNIEENVSGIQLCTHKQTQHTLPHTQTHMRAHTHTHIHTHTHTHKCAYMTLKHSTNSLKCFE